MSIVRVVLYFYTMKYYTAMKKNHFTQHGQILHESTRLVCVTVYGKYKNKKN